MISSPQALSRHFSFWPFDEDSCFSTSSEICFKFPLFSSARRGLNKMHILDESPQKRQHSAGGLTDYDTFRSSAQVPKNVSAICRVFFNILQFSLGKLNLNAFFN